jgi:hypothetical protein
MLMKLNIHFNKTYTIFIDFHQEKMKMKQLNAIFLRVNNICLIQIMCITEI